MPSVIDFKDVPLLPLHELRRRSIAAVDSFDESIRSEFAAAQAGAARRATNQKIDRLVEEFQSSISSDIRIEYELAFLATWANAGNSLYDARWWVNEHDAGVYFIYDQAEQLQYVGSSCGGALGNRIYEKGHHAHRQFVDIVLFDRCWCHLGTTEK